MKREYTDEEMGELLRIVATRNEHDALQRMLKEILEYDRLNPLVHERAQEPFTAIMAKIAECRVILREVERVLMSEEKYHKADLQRLKEGTWNGRKKVSRFRKT